MTGIALRRTAVCVAALMTGQAALAQVTAQDVWNNWSGMLALYGSENVTIGNESYAGGVLTISDLVMTVPSPDVNVTATLPQVVFTENGDGTVSVAMSDTYTITIADTTTFDPVNMTLSLFQSNLAMLVSGTPDAMEYEVSADRYGLRVDEITEGGTPIPMEASITFNGLSGAYAMTAADEIQSIAYAVDVASVDLLVDVNIAEEGVVALVSGKIEALSSEAAMDLPATFDPAMPEMMLAAGFAVDAGYSFGAMSALWDVNDGYSQNSGSFTAASGDVSTFVSSDAVDYDVTVTGLSMTATGGDMPFPITVSLDEYGMGLAMPLAPTDEPVDVGARINLTNLTLNEEIWSLFDPAAMLPRDPATLIVELSGSVKVLVDFMNPESMGMAPMGLPAEPHAVSLDALNISVAGAQITGGGAFTFDVTDMMTIPGVPRPEGSVSLQANGLNGLIDTLVQMGLLPEDQVMGARMMMGMFATVTGDDQLESTLEVNAEGHVLVNGQRIQ